MLSPAGQAGFVESITTTTTTITMIEENKTQKLSAKEIWESRNPQHECGEDGKDLFWKTMEMCMSDYAAQETKVLQQQIDKLTKQNEQWSKDYSDLQNRNIKLKESADLLAEQLDDSNKFFDILRSNPDAKIHGPAEIGIYYNNEALDKYNELKK